ncbi:MAG: Gfo/Idh/MocA family oxidoreductase [Bacteroidota bacterium]|jgi:predicted dehydrogenase
MLRGALIGLGNIAVRGHIPAYLTDQELASNMELVAVMDTVEANREKASQCLPNARFYTDIASLFEHERLDFVDICTPPSTHYDYIRACCSRGLHILCEKPLTESYITSAQLVNVIRGSEVAFVPCHQYKYSPLWKSIHDSISSGAVGHVALAQFNVFRLQADTGSESWNPAWRTNRNHSGGGILVDTGAHYFYLAQYFFGMPTRVSALLRTLKHHEYGVEDTAVVILEYDGMLMSVNLTWAAGQRANSVSIVGTEGRLVYDGAKLTLTNANGFKEIPMPDVSDKQQYIRWYASLFKEFIRRVEVKDTGDDLLVEALNVMKLLDLSYRASEKRAVMQVS